MTDRRHFLFGLTATLASPAIVKAENLMKIATLRSSIELDSVLFNSIRRYYPILVAQEIIGVQPIMLDL